MEGEVDAPYFDQELADTYVGKHILVGLSYYEEDGTLIEHVQMHGVIEAANLRGIKIALHGTREGESWTMPPDLRSVKPAKPGTYTLRSTGETVADPDLLATWNVTKHRSKADKSG
jgi:hypothetical protein